MSYDFTVRQSGMFRSRLNMSDITGNDLLCGMQDRFFRFFPIAPREGYLIIYDPNRIGCGVQILWENDMRDRAVLSIPHIASVNDLDLLQKCLFRIMKRWDEKSFIFAGREYRKEELPPLMDEIRMQILDHMKNDDGMAGERNVMLIRGAKWPLFLSRERIRRFAEEKDEAGFAALLRQLQEIDCDYISCHVYISDDQKGYIGVYTIREGTDWIIPDVPRPPLGMTDPVSGDMIRCGRYLIRMLAKNSGDLIGQMDYYSFMASVPSGQTEKYDEHHVILRGFTKEQFTAGIRSR